MVFKKKSWMKYGSQGMKCEIKIFDENDSKLSFFKFQVQDKKAKNEVLSILKRAYGLNLSSSKKENDKLDVKKIMKEDLGVN